MQMDIQKEGKMTEVEEYLARYKQAVKDTKEVDSIRGSIMASSILREVEAKGLMDEFVEKMESKND